VRLKLLDLIRPGTEQIIVDIPTLRPAALIDYTESLNQLAAFGLQHNAEELIRAYVNAMPLAQRQALMLRWLIEMPKGSLPVAPPPRGR
jgi:hypothetical protein